MNIYIIGEGEDNNSTIPKFVRHFEELHKLNELKPKFVFSFSKEQSGDNDGKYELPGSQLYDNFQYLQTDIMRVEKSLQDNGIQSQMNYGFYPVVPILSLGNAQMQSGSGDQQEQSQIQINIRDSQDLNSIQINDKDIYNQQINQIIESDFKQPKFQKTIPKGEGLEFWFETIDDSEAAKHQYQDFTTIEDELDLIGFQSKKNIDCQDLDTNNLPSFPNYVQHKIHDGQAYESDAFKLKQDFDQNKEIYPSQCNKLCTNEFKYQLLRPNIETKKHYYTDQEYINQDVFCECFKEEPTLTKRTDKLYNEYSCFHSNGAVKRQVREYTQINFDKIIISTSTENYQKLIQDQNSVNIDEDIAEDKRFIKTQTADKLDENSLTGSFVRPIHFKNYKLCNAIYENQKLKNISIDFQADLIAQPIIIDTQSISKQEEIAYLDLNKYSVEDGNNMQVAFQMNQRFEIKNDENKNAKNCANLCKAYDQFAISDEMSKTKLDCVCFNEQNKSIIQPEAGFDSNNNYEYYEAVENIFNKKCFIDVQNYESQVGTKPDDCNTSSYYNQYQNPNYNNDNTDQNPDYGNNSEDTTTDYNNNTDQQDNQYQNPNYNNDNTDQNPDYGNNSEDTTTEKDNGEPKSFTVYQFKGQTNELNHILFKDDRENQLSFNQGQKYVTSVRNKLLILPKVDNNLNCTYKSEIEISMQDGENHNIYSRNIDLKSKMQQTMINGKTVFVCVPPMDSFDYHLSIQPQFEEFPEFDDDNKIRDMKQFFGDTLPYKYEGCPLVKEFASTTVGDDLTDMWIDDINESMNLTKSSDFKLPRTISQDKVSFQYFSQFHEQLNSEDIIKQLIKEKLDNKYNFNPDDNIFSIQNVSMVFCFILVFLSIFDESNESLFCMYVTTRLYILQSSDKQITCTQRIYNSVIWFLSVTFSIIRIGYTTTKILIIILLMNWGANITDLMMNSLALIFVLELDSVTYSWLFDTNKGIEISCDNFLGSQTNIKIWFNLRYYVPSFLYIYFMYIRGIYSQKQPDQTVFDLFNLQLDNLFNGNFQDSSVLYYAVLQVFAFGTLFEECTFQLYRITKLKQTSCAWLIMMFITVFMCVQVITVLFVYTDQDFQVTDFQMCLSNKNLNCGNNQMLTDKVWSKNLSLLLFTPVQFALSIVLNFIWAFIWPQIEPLFNNTEEETNNIIKTEYNIEKDKLNNKLELAGDKYDSQNNEENTILNEDVYRALWKSQKSFSVQQNSFMQNYESFQFTRKSIDINNLGDELKALLIFIENGGEICVKQNLFAKFEKISINLVHEIAKIKQSVNEAMDRFNEILFNEFESDEDEDQ